MALTLNTNSLLLQLSSSSRVKGSAFSKLSSSGQHSRQFQLRCAKIERKTPRYCVIRAASSVQQKTGTVSPQKEEDTSIEFTGVHHVGFLIENLEHSLKFYQGVLGLEINPDRPADKLPYRGAWFWVGDEMIHLMELPNPDPKTGRDNHGGRDRHACVAVKSIEPLKHALDKAGIEYTLSRSGRPALFARDPDCNTLEFTQA